MFAQSHCATTETLEQYPLVALFQLQRRQQLRCVPTQAPSISSKSGALVVSRFPMFARIDGFFLAKRPTCWRSQGLTNDFQLPFLPLESPAFRQSRRPTYNFNSANLETEQNRRLIYDTVDRSPCRVSMQVRFAPAQGPADNSSGVCCFNRCCNFILGRLLHDSLASFGNCCQRGSLFISSLLILPSRSSPDRSCISRDVAWKAACFLILQEPELDEF